LLSNCQYLIGTQVRIFEPCWRLSKGAVTALVATQHGERNENFWRVRDPTTKLAVAHCTRISQQLIEGCIKNALMYRQLNPPWA
jgi:hypothetical protein